MNVSNFYRLFRTYFSIDLRVLKYFRIIYAVCVIYFVLELVTNFYALIGNFGFLELKGYLKTYSCNNCYSFFFISDSLWFYVFLFFLFFLGLILILLNKYSNLAFIIIAILMQGFIFRFRPFVFGGHNMAFWIALIGAALPHDKKNSGRYFGSIVVDFFADFSIYFQSVYKVGPSWHETYTSLEAALRNPIYKTDVGILVADLEFVNKILTRLTIFIEVYGSVFFIFGFLLGKFARWYKFVFGLCLIVFHITSFYFFELSFFPIISIVLLILIIDIPWLNVDQISRLGSRNTRLLSLLMIFLIVLGFLGLNLNEYGIPTQKFNYFAEPLNQFVDLTVYVKLEDRTIAINPIADNSISLTPFYIKRLSWNMSKLNLKSATWVSYFCKKFLNSSQLQLIYNWTQFDSTNRTKIGNKSYQYDYSCINIER